MPSKRRSEAKRWFHQARYDLKAARWNIEGEFFDTACFLSQQAAEKCLKSLLYYLGSRREALMTHSIVEMILHAEKQLGTLSGLLQEARALDLHYIPSRYPNGLPSGYPHQFYTRRIAEQAADAAAKIHGAIADHFRTYHEEEILREEN